MIIRVHHVQITVPRGHEDEARSFYCGPLGLVEVAKPEALQGRGGFWMELAGVQIHVGTEDGVDRNQTKAHLAYQVEDLNAWRERLQRASVTMLESVEIPGWDRFEFRDPFGNRIEMLEALDS